MVKKGLCRLPVEMLAEITDNVSPADLLSFALTCSRIHAVCKARIDEAAILAAKFRKISLSGRMGVARFLVEVVNRPRIAYYVKHLHILDNNYIDHDEVVKFEKEGYEHHMEQLDALLAKCVYLDESDCSAWYDLILLLLSVLSNLEALELPLLYSDAGDQIDLMMNRISSPYQEPGDSRPLSKLTKLILTVPNSDDGQGDNLRDLQVWLRFGLLPQITDIHWNDHRDFFEDSDEEGEDFEDKLAVQTLGSSIAPRFPELKRMTLNGCMISPGHLSQLLENLDKVEHFSYNTKAAHDNGKHLRDILQILTDSRTVNSLRYLQLGLRDDANFDFDDSGDSLLFIGALQCFQNLRSLRLSSSMLYDAETQRLRSMAEMLPSSIHEFIIDDCDGSKLALLLEMAQLFKTLTKENFPGLKRTVMIWTYQDESATPIALSFVQYRAADTVKSIHMWAKIDIRIENVLIALGLSDTIFCPCLERISGTVYDASCSRIEMVLNSQTFFFRLGAGCCNHSGEIPEHKQCRDLIDMKRAEIIRKANEGM